MHRFHTITSVVFQPRTRVHGTLCLMCLLSRSRATMLQDSTWETVMHHKSATSSPGHTLHLALTWLLGPFAPVVFQSLSLVSPPLPLRSISAGESTRPCTTILLALRHSIPPYISGTIAGSSQAFLRFNLPTVPAHPPPSRRSV